mmetsp:Transcript_25923/g.29656  ORF Transcript_25923/g.29656 Transcript_25923/m.29656 type:complete len:364 (+) Transcript_25923:55-1146(+)
MFKIGRPLVLLLLMQLTSLSSSLSISTKITDSPYLHATFDYSAANEYIETHYGQKSYFTKEQTKLCEPVYNARNFYDSKDKRDPPLLEKFGFDLFQLPMKTNWNDLESIQRDYLPELELTLRRIFEEEEGQVLEDVIFWHPMWRNNNKITENRVPLSSSPPLARTSPPAPMVHIDNDVGAYEFEDFLSLLKANSVSTKSVNWEKVGRALLLENKRFVIVNAWRNIHHTDTVQQAPLALYCPQYHSKNDCFPRAKPQQNKSSWYLFPDMTPDEVLLFKQYDRRIDRISDIWHCALTQYQIAENTKSKTSIKQSDRQSLDIRALCIFKDTVSDELNRYHDKRPRAKLSLEESECFCTEQAKERLL